MFTLKFFDKNKTKPKFCFRGLNFKFQTHFEMSSSDSEDFDDVEVTSLTDAFQLLSKNAKGNLF
jgi:hypothetical protein